MTADELQTKIEYLDELALKHKTISICCGERDNLYICAAPACHFGDIMKALHDYADELRARLAMMEDTQ